VIDPATAAHEARHASAALALGLPITKATAIPDGGCSGRVEVEVDPGRLRDHALMILAGALGEPGWPPDRPPDAKWQTEDAHQLKFLAERLGLDQRGWHKLVADAWNLAAEPAFERLELAVATLLEQGHVLDRPTLARVKAIVKEENMQHLTVRVKAATTVTGDEGVFEAVISTESIDREKDIVIPEAMVKALHGWERPIPLAWNHSTKAEDIIGSLDGPSARVEDAR
jgi:hypothetical protein